MAFRLFGTLLGFAAPFAVFSKLPYSPYYYCMESARTARSMTLEQHLESGTWLLDDQRCSK